MSPETDGIDHVNVYSKGATRLGRLLSNFAPTPFHHPDLGYFSTVEGYWYYVMTGDERLRHCAGWEAKSLGKRLKAAREHPSVDELRSAYKAKLAAHGDIWEMLNTSTLPLKHYYVYGDRVVEPKEWQWTVELWNEFKR